MAGSYGKAVFAIVLLAMAGFLSWFGLCSNRIAAKDEAFLTGRSCASAFPEVVLIKGNIAFFRDMDAVAAVDHFKKAMVSQPLLIEAWLALARAELILDRREEAFGALRMVVPQIRLVSTWKWEELLLANDLHDEPFFAYCFNFILDRLPERVDQACFLARGFWKEWSAALPHIAPANRVVFLSYLMKAKEVDAALSLWRLMEVSPTPPDLDLKLRFCNFLLYAERMKEAKTVWEGWKTDVALIDDGGFENSPSDKAFGWRFGKHPDVVVERSREAPQSGNHSLHLRFGGAKNVNFSHVSQIVPVESGRKYRLKYQQRSRDLTTDQGVFVQVSGFKCRGLQAQGEPAVGTIPWTEEYLEVTVPEECEAIVIQVRRKESLKLNNKISGDYWLDDLVLSAES